MFNKVFEYETFATLLQDQNESVSEDDYKSK